MFTTVTFVAIDGIVVGGVSLRKNAASGTSVSITDIVNTVVVVSVGAGATSGGRSIGVVET